jgi:poly(3-hydroxybutyrate) depolymerase
VIAAIAPVSGGGPREKECDGPVPVLIMHGRSDDVVPYGQGEKSFRRWSSENACEEQAAAAETACVEATGCSADVRFCSFSGSHSWPRDAARRIVEFLLPQRR